MHTLRYMHAACTSSTHTYAPRGCIGLRVPTVQYVHLGPLLADCRAPLYVLARGAIRIALAISAAVFREFKVILSYSSRNLIQYVDRVLDKGPHLLQ